MNARCNNESIRLFEKLPLLPLLRVHSHLNASSLVLAALLSEKWDSIVVKEGMRMESVWDINTTHDGGVYIQLKFKNYKNEPLEIGFKEDAELGNAEDVRVHQENNLITFYHKNHRQLEESCFKAFQLLNSLFPPASYGRISVSLDSRTSSFPIRFLLQLPRGTADFVGICGDQEVDCGDLVKLLRNVKVVRTPDYSVESTLDIRVNLRNLVKSNEIILQGTFISIADARFLSIDSLMQLNFQKFQAGHNDFTSEDFNAFLHAWMKTSPRFWDVKVTFDIREDQNIRMEEVMKGLNPHLGTPRIRDRWRFDRPAGIDGDLYPTATDYGDGWDIVNPNGMIGTVLLESNRLTFITWSSPFCWQGYVKSVENEILSITRYVDVLNRDRERYEKKAKAGKMELFPNQEEFLRTLPEQLNIEQNRLAAQCDVKEKLLTIWKNDETMNEPPLPGYYNNSLPADRSVLILGSADIALDAIPLAFQFTRQEFRGEVSYTKMEGRLATKIILITEIASIDKEYLRSSTAFIYAYSDSDSFDRLSEMFISLRKLFGTVRTIDWPIRAAHSLLVQMPGAEDKKKPDPFDVESFQRNSWSDATKFDPNPVIEFREFLVSVL